MFSSWDTLCLRSGVLFRDALLIHVLSSPQMSGGSKDKMGPGPECRLRGGATSSAMPKVGPSDRDKGVLDHEEIKESSEKDKENDGEEEKEQADEKQDTEKKKEKKAKEKRCDKQKTKRNKERNSRFRQRHNNEDGDENPPLRKPCCFCWCCCCSCSWFANFLSNCASCLCFRRFLRLLSDRNWYVPPLYRLHNLTMIWARIYPSSARQALGPLAVSTYSL
ncbi:hypothetical protein FOCC_FOCC007001 [Frankliniella occidentalis]|nr:hypothetical protein FOCC_FOCC007001 [Frankliniella occidentalis]